jgi:hypothetical protein
MPAWVAMNAPNLTLCPEDRLWIDQELQKARHSSLIAARRGEYEKVAQFTLRVIVLSNLASDPSFRRPDVDPCLPDPA